MRVVLITLLLFISVAVADEAGVGKVVNPVEEAGINVAINPAEEVGISETTNLVKNVGISKAINPMFNEWTTSDTWYDFFIF